MADSFVASSFVASSFVADLVVANAMTASNATMVAISITVAYGIDISRRSAVAPKAVVINNLAESIFATLRSFSSGWLKADRATDVGFSLPDSTRVARASDSLRPLL